MRDKFGLDFRIVDTIVETKVKPERAKNNRKVYRDYWWHYAEKRPAMLRAIADLDRILVITIHSSTGLPLWQPTGQVFSHALAVFATDRTGSLALLSSAVHYWWAIARASSLKGDLRYTPSDAFETFPRPTLTPRADKAGEMLDSYRSPLMVERRLGLTKLYNLVHDPAVDYPAIARLRDIHVEIDEAVRAAYAADEEADREMREFEAKVADAPLPAWRDIDLGHGFHETRQGTRFTIIPQARDDVLDKLLALNFYRHEQEARQGRHTAKKKPESQPTHPPKTPSSNPPPPHI